MNEDDALGLPWSVGEDTEYEGFNLIPIGSGDGDEFDALVWVLDSSPYGGPFGIKPVDRKRAALIVRAVNRDALFDEMVEALEPLRALAERVFDDGMNAGKTDDTPVYGFDGAYVTYGQLRRARAVLSKVREASNA